MINLVQTLINMFLLWVIISERGRNRGILFASIAACPSKRDKKRNILHIVSHAPTPQLIIFQDSWMDSFQQKYKIDLIFKQIYLSHSDVRDIAMSKLLVVIVT